jgi:hypothetical protein
VRSEHMNLPKGYKPSIAKQGGLRPGFISVSSKVAITVGFGYQLFPNPHQKIQEQLSLIVFECGSIARSFFRSFIR